MTQYSFSTGTLWGERTDVTGSGIGPVQFGTAQDIQINFDATTKKLYGQRQVARFIARGQLAVTGKIGFARIQMAQFSQIYFGLTTTPGQLGIAQYEADVIPVLTPFQVTVANAANFISDLGVFYAAGSNAPFTRVTGPAAAGQYSVNSATGIYTFSGADAGQGVVISYRYANFSGTFVTLTNQLQGVTPTFKATFYNSVSPGSAATLGLTLNACTSSKLSMPFKMGDFTIVNLEFEAMEDMTGNIGLLSTLE